MIRTARCQSFPGFLPHLTLLLVLLLLYPSSLPAHVEEPASQPHKHGEATTIQGNETAVGVDEHLAEKIPLDIRFRDESGNMVRLADLITVPAIILPVYYSCTNVCNFLQAGLASTLPSIRPKPDREYRVISVSFDENETPEQAARSKRMYLSSMNVPFPETGWRFLTGDAQSIRRLTDAAGFRFQRKGRDFIHPVTSLVVASDGTIVRYLYGTTFLPKDLTLALLEARDGKIGATIRKVVGYCFSFDPAGKTYVFNLLRVSASVVILCTLAFLAFLIITGRKPRKPPSGGS